MPIQSYFKKYFGCVLSVLVIFVSTLAFASDNLPEQLKTKLKESLSGSLTPGAVLLVSSPSIGTISVASGLADKAQQIPMKASDTFRLASMSKTFLAVTVMKLAEIGDIDLDANIADLLPVSIDVSRVPNGNKVTVRQLLQMRSGIPNYTDYDSYSDLVDKMEGQRWSPELGVQLVYDQKPNFEPGKSYEYSNTNYLLLQLIVENKEKTSYSDVMKEQIFDPLHLNDTFVETGAENNYLSTHGYELDDNELTDVTDLNDGFGLGDGGTISTVADLNHFVQALLKDKTVLKNSTLQQMLAVKDDYGLGIYREKINGEWAWTHNGASSGYQGQYYYFPNQQLSIVLLTNYFDSEITDDLVSKIVKLIAKSKFDEEDTLQTDNADEDSS